MDEKSGKAIGEAIGEAIAKSNEKMSEKFVEMMTKMQTDLTTGVVTEVEHAELAGLLHKRADGLRARAEEIAMEKPEVATMQSFLESMPPFMRGDLEATEAGRREAEARLRTHNERFTKIHQARVKDQTTGLRTQAERLDFMAKHLEPRKYRLDARELDDLLFGDRHLGPPYLGVGIG